MGHLGLTPQSVNVFGGFRTQAKSVETAKRLVEDALILQDAGAFSVVLEAIPAQLAGYVSQKLEIPTIGIGAGAACDGQVLVTHDLLGLYDRFLPRFVRKYTDLHEIIGSALSAYRQDVEDQAFPNSEHSVYMDEQVWAMLRLELD